MAVATHARFSSYGDALGNNSSAEQVEGIDYLEKAFRSFDKDGSNYIDPQELVAALTMLGVKYVDGVEDVDGDGRLSLKDLDKDGDQKISFEEFKVLAKVLPKREHPIYKGALTQKPVQMPRDVSRASPVQRKRAEAQAKTQKAFDDALDRLCKCLGVEEVKRLRQDNYLRLKFDSLDKSSDGRVDIKELKQMLRRENPELSAMDAWLLMNVADTNNDTCITFDEFRKLMRTLTDRPQA
ncbi:hypothetical protein AB1Y20_004008 [Prymnesium parvum]|uniref:EF-hand domain-containing protein n=1 Tax=Prymnesium parvum TaxID=97485 RepID=A0AB34J8M7_PRYPA